MPTGEGLLELRAGLSKPCCVGVLGMGPGDRAWPSSQLWHCLTVIEGNFLDFSGPLSDHP